MEIRQLEYFAEVCRTKNFTKASENLRISQPAITKALHLLEEEMGVSLLNRTKRPVEITEPGMKFFERITVILDELKDATEEAAELQRYKSEMVTIGLPPWCGKKLKELMLTSGYTEKLKVIFNVLERSSPDIVTMVLNGELKLGWVIEEEWSSNLAFLPIEKQEVYCVLPKDSPLILKERLTFEELQNEKFTFNSFNSNSAIISKVERRCMQAGYKPKSSLDADKHLPNIDLVTKWVQLGHGISFMPVYIAESVTELAVRPMDPPLMLNVGLIWRKKDELSKGQKELIEFIKEYYTKNL
jgi:DNA-binding transcriptional LysR family regulator